MATSLMPPRGSRRALAALDRHAQRLILSALGPLARRRVRVLQRALGQLPGAFLAEYARWRPLWLQQGEHCLHTVVTQAIEQAMQAMLKQMRRRYGVRHVRTLFGAEGEEDDVDVEDDTDEGEDLDALPGIGMALAPLITALLYQPDAWGMTPLDRLMRQDTRTRQAILRDLQESERTMQTWLLLWSAVSVTRMPRLRTLLREVEALGRRALAGSPAARRQFLQLMRQARQEAQTEQGLSPRTRRAIEETLRQGHQDAQEATLATHLEGRALRQAELLARTLTAQAYAKATIALAKQAGVRLLRWELSGLHPRPDVCDTLEGEYAIRDLPAYPAHGH